MYSLEYFPQVNPKTNAFCTKMGRFGQAFCAFINHSNHVKMFYSIQHIVTTLSNLHSFPQSH